MLEPADNLSQIVATLQQIQLENAILRDSLCKLQASTSNLHPTESNLPPSQASPNSYTLEQKVSLPDKFDATRLRFLGFVNQIRLIIRLQPQCYCDDFRWVGLVGTLLLGSHPWWKPHRLSLRTFLHFLLSLSIPLVRQTDADPHSLNSIRYNKARVQLPTTPRNSINLHVT